MRNLSRIVILLLCFSNSALADGAPLMFSWLLTGGPIAPYLTQLPALFLCRNLPSTTLKFLIGGIAILTGPTAYDFAFEKLMDYNFFISSMGFLFGPTTILFGVAAAAAPAFWASIIYANDTV